MAPQLPNSTAAMSDNKPKRKSIPTNKQTTAKHVAKTTTSNPTKMKTKPNDALNKIAHPVHIRDPLIAVDFEVHGRVQGVFFRKHTLLQAEKLGVRGWCQNSEHDTVLGQLQGNRSKVEPMKKWLRNVGSPKSSIEKCEFRGEHEIDTITIEDFHIRR